MKIFGLISLGYRWSIQLRFSHRHQTFANCGIVLANILNNGPVENW